MKGTGKIMRRGRRRRARRRRRGRGELTRLFSQQQDKGADARSAAVLTRVLSHAHL